MARLAVALRVEPKLARAPARRASEPPSARRASSFAAASKASWEEFLGQVPLFRCTDPYFERFWAYRWYGLRLNAVAGGWGNYVAPTVCEGIAYFHQPITYSAQCHLRELRWARDPELARGILRTFVAHQRPDGSFPGRIYLNHAEGTDFYHADWGGALLALDAVHPSDDFLREVLPALARYAEWIVATRDAQRMHLYDVVDQYETGQEYMSRRQGGQNRRGQGLHRCHSVRQWPVTCDLFLREGRDRDVVCHRNLAGHARAHSARAHPGERYSLLLQR